MPVPSLPNMDAIFSGNLSAGAEAVPGWLSPRPVSEQSGCCQYPYDMGSKKEKELGLYLNTSGQAKALQACFSLLRGWQISGPLPGASWKTTSDDPSPLLAFSVRTWAMSLPNLHLSSTTICFGPLHALSSLLNYITFGLTMFTPAHELSLHVRLRNTRPSQQWNN